MKTLFETKATAVGGRNGHVKSEDGVLDLQVRIPESMGGPGGNYTNPEQLFAAGYAACFDSALNLVASMEKLEIKSQITATVGLAATPDRKYSVTAALEAKIEGVDKETAESLLEKAHAVCPYSNATRNNIDVQITLAS